MEKKYYLPVNWLKDVKFTLSNGVFTQKIESQPMTHRYKIAPFKFYAESLGAVKILQIKIPTFSWVFGPMRLSI